MQRGNRADSLFFTFCRSSFQDEGRFGKQCRECSRVEMKELTVFTSKSGCSVNVSFSNPSSRRQLSERAPFRAPIRARFWREWADQRASRTEGPCACLLKVTLHRPAITITK